MDLETALCIASMAGSQTHDELGNLLPSVWCKRADDLAKETGVLLETHDLRKILLEQMRAHIAKRQDLILESEETLPVVQWIVQFTSDWEDEYRNKQNRKYDISQKIYAAMMETFHIVESELESRGHSTKTWKLKFSHSTDSRHFTNEKAAIRSLFRVPEINPILCKVASKILQKREVCNKAGAYSSKIQRHDVTQQLDDAVSALEDMLDAPVNVFLHYISKEGEFWKDLSVDCTLQGITGNDFA